MIRIATIATTIFLGLAGSQAAFSDEDVVHVKRARHIHVSDNCLNHRPCAARCPSWSCYSLFGAYGPYGGAAYWSRYGSGGPAPATSWWGRWW
jgi:hypothetical protein